MKEQLTRLQERFGRWSFSAVMAIMLALLFGPAVYAEFGRQTGPLGWGYGYGYGNSYGDGWDSGTFGGYMTEFHASGDEEFRDYGYGYGRMLPLHDDAESISYDAETDIYDIDAANLPDIFEAGLATPVEADDLAEASAFYMHANVRVHLGDDTVLLHRGDLPYFDETNDLLRLRATSDFPVDGTHAVRGQVTLGPGTTIPLPFAFSFYGEEKTRFRVSSNGFITFTDNNDDGCCDGQAMPDNEDPNDVVAGTWMDLVPYDGTFKYEVFGSAPYRVAVIEFDDVPEYGEEDVGSVSFQIHLHEEDGSIEIHTGLIDVRDHHVTQGIENSSGQHGTTVVDVESDEDDILMSEFAYRFTPGSPEYVATSIAYDPYEMTGAAKDVAPPDDDSFFPEEDIMYFDSGEADVSISVGHEFDNERLRVWERDSVWDEWDRSWGECVVEDGFCDFSTDEFGYFVVVGGSNPASGSSGSGSGDVTPAVQLTYPVGGEHFTGGSTKTISWTTTGSVDHSRVSFSPDSGVIWTVIAESVTGTSRSWNVPEVATTNGRIRVEGMDDAGGVISTSISPADFSISLPEGEQGPEDEREGVTGPSARGREEANRVLPPGYPVDTLVKLADDRDGRTEGDTTVYYIGLDTKRHPFPTRSIYDSWYQDFSEVRPIDGATLASIPLGAPILVRPGTRWVKITSDPKTYYIEPGYSLRWIRDEVAARLLGGPDWNKNVLDVDVSLFSGFSTGPDIDAAGLASDWPSGALVKSTGAPEVFYITTTGRRSFVNEAAMKANHFQQHFVTTTGGDAGWMSKALGAAITGLEDALFSLMH